MSIDPQYLPTLWGMLSIALLMIGQLLVADVSAIRIRHTPGTPLAPKPEQFVFRAARAHANTNESVASFILLASVGLLAHADSLWLNTATGLYVASRVAHMLFYYWHKALLRSLSFGVCILALVALGVVDILALLAG